MINKLHTLKGKTKINFHQIYSYFYDEKIYWRQSGSVQFNESNFVKNVEMIGKITNEVLLLQI